MSLGQILSETQMLKIYQKSTPIGPHTEVQDFLAYLRAKDLSLNPKLQASVFQLKNGLPFIGMAAKEKIQGGEVLIRVPENLILSSPKAASEMMLSEVFKDPFFTGEDQSWEDRVIIVYCMFLLDQKEEGNPWFEMVRHFPKECDVAFFWSPEELDSFKDKTLKRSAELDRRSFEEEWIQFQELQRKHEILQRSEFNRDNYKIMFMTLMNRAFGASLNFISLAPLAELFNHHCNTVFYSTEKSYETYFQSPSEVPDEVESNESCESDEYLEQDEFSYDKLDMVPYNWENEESYKLLKKQKVVIDKEVVQILKIIENELKWEDFTIKVVGPLIFKTKVINKQYIVGRKPFVKAKEELAVIRASIQKYKDLVGKYYLRFNKKPYIKVQKPEPPKKEGPFNYPPVTKDFESLIISTGKRDEFQQNNQVFFNYGKNSNRTLLLHYGFALEGNRYEHCWVSLKLHKYLVDFPDVIEKVMDKNLSLVRKFKIYHHKLNVDLIIFFRLNNWVFYGQKSIDEIFQVHSISKEVRILQQIIEFLQEQVKVYEGDYDLTDSSLNYHQYFIQVYHLEKMNILKKQIHLLNLLISVLIKIDKGVPLGDAIKELTKSEINFLDLYLSAVKI